MAIPDSVPSVYSSSSQSARSSSHRRQRGSSHSSSSRRPSQLPPATTRRFSSRVASRSPSSSSSSSSLSSLSFRARTRVSVARTRVRPHVNRNTHSSPTSRRHSHSRRSELQARSNSGPASRKRALPLSVESETERKSKRREQEMKYLARRTSTILPNDDEPTCTAMNSPRESLLRDSRVILPTRQNADSSQRTGRVPISRDESSSQINRRPRSRSRSRARGALLSRPRVSSEVGDSKRENPRPCRCGRPFSDSQLAAILRFVNEATESLPVCTGLSKSKIECLPTNVLQHTMPSPCTICLEDMVRQQKVRLLPCMHCFHVKCIDEWLGQKAQCPLDRLSADPCASF